MKNMNPVQLSYHLNENLVKEMVKFLHSREICALSMVSKLYHKYMKKCDYRLKEDSYRQFCSEYESYNIKLRIMQASQLSSSSIVFQNPKRTVNEKGIPYNYTWKGLINIGVSVKEAWKSFNHDKKLEENLIPIREALYLNLRECESSPRLRKSNNYVENDFNSSLQTFLYDFLYEQQDLYEDYDTKIKNQFFGFDLGLGIQCNKNELPFSYLITDFDILKSRMKTENDKKQLQYMRWYYCIDKPNEKEETKKLSESLFFSQRPGEMSKEEILTLKSSLKLKDDEDMIENGKSITLNVNFIKEQLISEVNPIFYTLKCLYLTLTFYCQYTMRFLYTTYRAPSKPKKLLSEYLKRYKNYVETAIDINQKLENLNVCLNYLYEDAFPGSPSFPKFSVLRMCMIIWNTELTSSVDEYDTMLSCLKLSLTSHYSKQLKRELSYLFQTKVTFSHCFQDTQDERSSSISKITSSSSVNSASTKTILNINKSIKKDTNSGHVLLEQFLSSLSDMFCNEYSVFYLNLLDLSTNNQFTEIEENFCDCIDNQLRTLYKKRVIQEKLLSKKMVEEVISYFSSNFYSLCILNKLKKSLYTTVRDVLTEVLTNTIIDNFNIYLDQNYSMLMKEYKKIDLNSKQKNPYQRMSIYNKLLNSLNAFNTSFYVKEYIVANYLSLLPSEQSSDIESLQLIEKWYSEEEDKLLKTNKQVQKEINRKQLPLKFDKYQRLLLSMSIKPTWNTIEEVRKLEASLEQMEQDDDMLNLDI